MQSFDLYSKLGVKTASEKFRKDLKEEAEGSTFNLTATRTRRAASTLPSQQVEEKPIGRSPVQFRKQLPRPDICKQGQDVNPNRFLSFNHSPLILTTTRRISSPNFALYQGRKKNLMYYSLEDQPQYDPNYAQVWRNTDRGLVAFNKIQGRKENRPSSTGVVRDVLYSGIDKKIRSPLLGRTQPKPFDPVLPVFMLGAITRGNSITQKTLEMNCYKNNGFLPLNSTFGHGWHQSQKISPQPIRGKCPKIVRLLTKGMPVNI